MATMKTRSLAYAALLALAAALSSPAGAQQFPTRPIRWIVPVPPGATTDIISRLIGGKMSEAWGQQVVVDNRTGGAFVIGTDIVAKSNPDGHTIGIFLTPHAVNPFVLKNLPYDAVKDFQPITLVAIVPGVMVTNANVPVTSLRDVIALAKAKPGQLNYGSPGPMTSGHLSMELLNLTAGIKILHVPYKGGAPATMDLMAGQVAVMFNNATTTVPHVATGKLRVLAVSTAKRSPALPDVPTVAEAGYPGFESNSWQGIVTRAGTPGAIVARLNSEAVRILSLPDVKNINQSLGNDIAGGSPEEFLAYIRREMRKWGKVIQTAGVKND